MLLSMNTLPILLVIVLFFSGIATVADALQESQKPRVLRYCLIERTSYSETYQLCK